MVPREAALVVEGVDRTLRTSRKAPLAVATLASVVTISATTTVELVHAAWVGVAFLLVTRCIRVDEAMRDQGIDVYYVKTLEDPDNRAIAFYEREGFERIGIRLERGRRFVEFHRRLRAPG